MKEELYPEVASIAAHLDGVAWFLYSVARNIKAVNILEIGTANGYTALYLARPESVKRVVTVDRDESNSLRDNLTLFDKERKIHFIQSDSRKVNIPYDRFGVDLAFIDGNHTYPFVRSDLKMIIPLVRSGGFIVLHDTVMDGVKQAVEEYQDIHKITYFGTFGMMEISHD